MGIPRVFQIAANPKEKKNLSSSLERFTTVDSTFLSTPPYQVSSARERERAENIALCVLGLSILMVAYAIYLTYKACKARDCQALESSRDELCSSRL